MFHFRLCASCRLRFLLFILSIQLVLLSLGCGSRNQKVQDIPQEIPPPPDTTLGPGDVFDIRVYGEKDLSSTFRVASDGTIDFPLLGTLHLSGKTPTEAAKIVEEGLVTQRYLKKPQVSVFVQEYNSKKISVFGQVRKPGTFSYQEGMSVVEAISIAGGFTSMARENDTTVIRIVNGKKRRFKVEVESIGQGVEANFIMSPGDIVFVPERIF